jgi:hypothetical protein
MQRVLTFVLALTCAVGAFAQSSLSGKWQGETPGGSSLLLELTAKETALTGTLMRGDEKSPITDGKVTKNAFTFKATIGGQTEGFAGEIKDDELRIWLERQGPGKAVTMTRVKPAPAAR